MLPIATIQSFEALGSILVKHGILCHIDRLFTTVGVHPTRCNEFVGHEGGAEEYIKNLKNILSENRQKIVAIGEFGLDYDRTKFCEADVQKK